jgi:beta-glucosidase
MPVGLHYSERSLERALKDNDIQEEQIDNSVLRILTAMYSIGLFDNEASGDPNAIVTSPEHCQLAREIAGKATVLLKNEGVLPLDPSLWVKKVVAVIGDQDTVYGGGSGHVSAAYTVSPAEGIGLALELLGYRVPSDIEVRYVDGSNIPAAVAAASESDIAVVTVATTSTEGRDRDNLSLGGNQDDLVTAVLAANPLTVVSVNTPGASLLPWSDTVPAILVSMLGGQESGNALADVLFGHLNPSARMPVTLPNKVGYICTYVHTYILI